MGEDQITVKEVVRQYLVKHGFDGLYSENGQCGCSLNQLMDCDNVGVDLCKPGCKVEDPEGEYDFLIVPKNDLTKVKNLTGQGIGGPLAANKGTGNK